MKTVNKSSQIRVVSRPSGFGILVAAVVLLGIFSCNGTESDYDATGTFEAVEVVVSSEATGQITNLKIEEGQNLKAGEMVGSVDSVQLYLKKMQLFSSQRSLQSKRPDVETQIASLKQQIETAKTERKRVENLLKSNAANKKQLDDVDAQIAVLEKQLLAQKTTLQNTNTGISEDASGLEIQIAQVNDQLKKCAIKSPITGTVLSKYAEMGEVATVGKPLFKVANLDNIILRAYLTTSQLSQVKLGQKLVVRTESADGSTKDHEGTVSWISDKSEFTPKTIQTKDERANTSYAVKILVANDGFIKIGMYGELKIATK